MNILVTGGAGYIGSHTSLALIDKGHEVTIIDNLITGNAKAIPDKASFLNSDIADLQKINALLDDNKFDLIMHFAGLVRVEESFEEPNKYKINNIDKAKTFFDCCISRGLNKIIFSSTAGVYGKLKDNIKLNETDKLDPSNPYAETKLELEKYLLNLKDQNKIKYIILRYFNVAGADKEKRSGLMSKNSNNLIKVVCEVATKKREKIIINGNDYKTNDGTAVRDFIHVSDLADIHLIVAEHLASNKESGIYNCGYGTGYSVKQVVKTMEQILNKNLNNELGPRRDGDIPYSVANNEKFKNKFNWSPKYNDLNYILSSALNWENYINDL
jgi:UDP-glucose 4-epimerase